jgi:hypothetical protein
VSVWEVSHRADRLAVPLADRHYNRQKIGSKQFVPPGRCFVLRHGTSAVWVTSWPFGEYVRHAWPGAWINSLFRNESEHLASAMICEAVGLTRGRWPDVPELGMVTFVDASKVRQKRNPGYCYLMAGFRQVGETRGGLLAFQMLAAEMPDPIDLPGRLAL